MKRTIAMLLCVLMLVPALPLTSFAAYENTHTNTGNQIEDLISVATTQIGYTEGNSTSQQGGTSGGSGNYTKYGAWYGINPGAWCAMFVSWCANQAGISSSIVPKHASCDIGMQWFQNKGNWQWSPACGGSYTPKRGDIIYFRTKTNQVVDSTHVGIVYAADASTVYTIEGNTSNKSARKSYSTSSAYILGYGTPAYTGGSSSGGGTSTGSYTITMDPNGGTMVGASSYNAKVGDTYTTIFGSFPMAARSGYVLTGWLCEKYNFLLTDSNMGNYYAVEESATFKAQWEVGTVDDTPVDESFTLTFDPNGGTITSGSTSYQIETGQTYAAAIGTLPVATRSGYTFNGWYTSKYNFTLNSNNMGNTFTASEDVALVAQWTKNSSTATITLNAGPCGNGVTKSISTTSLYHDKASIYSNYGIRPSGGSSDQRVFIGWAEGYDSKTGRGTGTMYWDVYSGSSTSTTLYAIWGYPIVFNADGGTYNDGSDKYVTYVANYANWNGASDATDPMSRYIYCLPDNFGNAPTKGNLERDCAPSYGLLTAANKYFTLEGNDQNLTIPPTGGALPWSSFRLTSTKYGTAVEFMAIWKPTVTYNSNGGSGSMSIDTLDPNLEGYLYEYNSYSIKSCAFTKSNATFTGWNTKPDGSGTSYVAGQSISQLSSSDAIVLYAQWSDGSSGGGSGDDSGSTGTGDYTITLNANGGSGTKTFKISDGQKYTSAYGSSTFPTPTKSNAVFNGWYNAEYDHWLLNGTSDTFKVCKDITYYAQWEEIPTCTGGSGSGSYTLTFNPNGGTMQTASSFKISLNQTYWDACGGMPFATKFGYQLEEWDLGQYGFTLSSESSFKGNYLAVAGNFTFTAVWTYIHGHSCSYKDVRVTVQPTCSAAGTKLQACLCGNTKNVSIATTSHSYTSYVSTQPGCTTAGVRTYICSICSSSYTESIAATGHSYVSHAAQAPTCTSYGWNAYQTCSKCDYTTYTLLDKLAHTEATRNENVINGGCLNDSSYDIVTYCSVCNDVLNTETVSSAAPGHDYSIMTTEPTCTSNGYKVYTCKNCSYSFTDEYASATSHSYKAVVTEPTCSTGGYTTYTCTACGYSYTDNETAASGHSYTAKVTTAATCTSAGVITYTCNCGDSYTERISATGHDYIEHAAKAATCTEAGWNAYKTCANCDYTNYKEIAATGHNEAVREENRKEASCTAAGSYDKVTYCTVCQSILDTETVSIPKSAHTLTEYEGKAPTCTEAGWKAYVECSKCDYTTYEEIAATDHNYIGVITPPTCTSDGYTTYTCTICSDSYTDDSVAAGGHDIATREENYVEADCTNDGSYDIVTYCTICQNVFGTETIIINSDGHDYESVTTEPDCTKGGYTVYTCTRCGDTYTDEATEALGHDYEASSTEADCTNGGYTVYTCTRCEDSYEGDHTDALGHDYTTEVIEPDCTNGGYTVYTCTRCEDSYEGDHIDALGHKEETREENYIEPDCTNAGSYDVITYCTVCEEEIGCETVPVEALGHDYSTEVIEPDCTNGGYTVYTCTRCEDSYEGDHIDALGHTETEVIETVVETSCGIEGSYYRVTVCDICGEELNREAYTEAALEHSYEVDSLELRCIHCNDGYNGFYFDAEDNKYYSVDGVITVGLFILDEKYYCSDKNGVMFRDGRYWVEGTSLADGNYNFDSEGAIVFPEGYNIVSIDDKNYLMKNGTVMERGLYEIGVGQYVFVCYENTLLKDEYMWVTKSYKQGIIDGEGCVYYFGSDFLLETDRFVEYEGRCYYIESDASAALGFKKIGEDYYYFNARNGLMYKDTMMWIGANDYGFEAGNYYFGEDGKMYIAPEEGIAEIIEEEGKLYYTIDGVKQFYGLFELDSEFYFAQANGVLAVDSIVWVSNTNDLVPLKAYYSFDEEGKLIKTGFVNAPTGYTYYYDNCELAKGLTKIGDDYYLFNASSGMLYKNSTMWIGADNAYGFEAGYYDFLEDGRMYIADPNGEKSVVNENGSYYFKIDGVAQGKGVYELDGEYYYAKADGTLYCDTVIWLTAAIADQFGGDAGYYAFDSEAKLVKTGFIEAPNGYSYYREELVLAKGLTKIGDDYYFFNKSSGSMYKDSNMWIGADNAYGFAYGYYYFDAEGKMA